MDIRKLQRAVVDALEDVKAQDIKVFNTTELTSLFDRVVIASGTSNRQTRALASSVEDKARELGVKVIAREGDETGEWVLVDLGDIVVHIMQPVIREYYNLEEIWGAKSVRVKLGADAPGARGLVTKTAKVTKTSPATKTTRTTKATKAVKSTKVAKATKATKAARSAKTAETTKTVKRARKVTSA